MTDIVWVLLSLIGTFTVVLVAVLCAGIYNTGSSLHGTSTGIESLVSPAAIRAAIRSVLLEEEEDSTQYLFQAGRYDGGRRSRRKHYHHRRSRQSYSGEGSV